MGQIQPAWMSNAGRKINFDITVVGINLRTYESDLFHNLSPGAERVVQQNAPRNALTYVLVYDCMHPLSL